MCQQRALAISFDAPRWGGGLRGLEVVRLESPSATLPADRPGLSQSHHFVRFCVDDRIAFAGAVLETVTVEDFDMPARIPNQPCLLQSMGLDRNGGSPHPEHMRKKFLRQGEGGASYRILRLQKPPAKPTSY
jgi:hypothetical protein